MPNYPNIVFLNNEYLDPEDARISIFDRGFMFGDGIYDVIASYQGKLFQTEQHLERLSYCLKQINLDFDVSGIPENINYLIGKSQLNNSDFIAYIQITRGIAPRQHHYPDNISPTSLIYLLPFSLPGINKNQIKVITCTDFRWHRCDIKNISLLPNIMANQSAHQEIAFENIFIRNGNVTEGTHSNIFFVKDNIVFTHPVNQDILDGITRKVVLKLCEEIDLEVRELPIKKEEIIDMDEAFLTGTTTQIASIKQIDDHHYYDTEIGPVTKKLQEAFLLMKSTVGVK